MGKVKNMAWDSATNFLSQIEDDVISQKITKDEALTKMQNSNEMLSLEGINSKSDAEEWLDDIHKTHNLLETPTQQMINDNTIGIGELEDVIDNMKETNLEKQLWGENE